MAPVTTVRDMLYHNNNARVTYERFIAIGCKLQPAQNALALLLWLDQGSQHVMSLLLGMCPIALGHLIDEVSSVIACLHVRNLVNPPTPLLTALCQDSRLDHPGFFAFNQDVIVRGIADILDGIGTLIFNDRLYVLLRRYQTGLFPHFPELEAPYTREAITVPEDYRSMFVTFSKGQPVEREEIFSYFRETWGDCIVRVLMEKTMGGAQPMYGRIIFKSPAFVSLVLNGEERETVIIGGREIWLRMYIPRHSSSNST